MVRFDNTYGAYDRTNLAHRSRRGLIDGITAVLAGCRPLLRPGGVVAVVARPWRRDGLLVDLPGQLIDAAADADLHHIDRRIALHAAVQDRKLVPRHSFFQLTVTRASRAEGRPISLAQHDDVLVFGTGDES